MTWMKFSLLATVFVLSLGHTISAHATSFTFKNEAYMLRWNDGKLFEMTPEGQDDLDDWQTMVSFILFQSINDGDALADIANQTLARYQTHKGMVMATDSVPASKDQPAEHFIAYLFISPDSFEFAANRVVLSEGIGVSVVYSRRFYNKKGEDGQVVSDWMEKHGPEIEASLMAIPKEEIRKAVQKLLSLNAAKKGNV
ncbi:hypothetical protein HC752_08625 [Vibrio sp. S9_S30]|uniref:hypothetical protein n=1 Tax=Vibrio sp. S9_S30 TaxID=2720226 RepID=UPI00167FFA2C|nr:hypothetical protein [Vibrio sp. S9_S30]MBD1557000.1 hypothetical protein [Vibrio sp. S9_S30]